MRISELKNAMVFVQKQIAEPNLPDLFHQLIQVLRQNVQLKPNQQPQPISEQKKNLISGIRAISIALLSLNERRILQIYIDLDLLGDMGVDKINSIFTEHNLDPAGAINAFDSIRQRYVDLIESSERTLGVLKPLKVEEIETDIEEGKAVVQITFKDKATIGSVTDLREYADQWWNTIRSFGLLTDSTTDEAKILSIQHGSIIIEVSAIYILIKALGIAADKTLSSIERLLDLKKKILEIKNLHLRNRQIEKDLEKEADTFLDNRAEEITEHVIKKINESKAKEGETVNALQISVRGLFEFFDDGGTVDCRLPALEEPPEDAKELKVIYDRIRELEAKVEEQKLLPPGQSGR